MNLKLHRKQMVVLTFATILAVASYWIPTPEEATPTSSTSSFNQKANV